MSRSTSNPNSSVSGTLEQLPFAEFVQTLSNLGKSGKLSLYRFGERGFVFFQEGRIIGAASTSVRETLGSLLIGQRLVTADQLAEALEAQRGSREDRKLGSILIDQGYLSGDDLQGVIRQQTQRILSELIGWKHGHFEFDAAEIQDRDEIQMEILDMRLADGLSAEGILLAAAVGADERSKIRAEIEAAEPESGAHTLGAGSLRDLLFELRSPEFTGELTQEVVNYVRRGLANRCVLFSATGDHFCGMSYYGPETDADLMSALRQLRIPLDEPSVLADVAARQRAFQGVLGDEPWNRSIVDTLGGEEPEEIIAAPLVVDGRVTMVVYGDAVGGEKPLGSASDLELLMLQVGLAMEKRRLEQDLLPTARRTDAEPEELASELFRSLLDSDPEPILVVDPNGTILYANEAFGVILARPPGALPGEEIGLGVHPDDLSDLMEIVQEVGRGGAPGGNTVRFGPGEAAWRKCYLLPSSLGRHAGRRLVMLRALTASEIHTRFDPLTGVLDYEALVDRLGRKLDRSARDGGDPFALLFVGIDHFTVINTRFGWTRGNEVLRTVADRLALNLRPGDLVCRAGGDRFCVILDRLHDGGDAALVAQRIIEFLGEPITLERDQLELSVSVGVTTSQGSYRVTDDMLGDAKAALEEAKVEGGNTSVRRS